MGKKRKAGSIYTGNTVAKDIDIPEGKPSIKTYEDVADSEDEFHINRDKVLLEERPTQKRQRRYKEEGTKS